MEADAEQFPVEVRRHCERVLDELERYRQDLATTPGNLTPQAVAEGRAAIEAAAAAARKILEGLGVKA